MQQRIELIARVFAETGVKDLFYKILEMVQKHENRQQIVRLRGDFVPIDPSEWKNKFDMSVSVGLGFGNRDQLSQALIATIQGQFECLKSGVNIVTPANIYAAFMELSKSRGEKNSGAYWTSPDKMPQQPPKVPPELQKMLQQLQQENQLLKVQLKGKQDKIALDETKTHLHAAVEFAKLDHDKIMQHNEFQNDNLQTGLQMHHDAIQSAQDAQLSEMELQQADQHKQSDLAMQQQTLDQPQAPQ